MVRMFLRFAVLRLALSNRWALLTSLSISSVKEDNRDLVYFGKWYSSCGDNRPVYIFWKLDQMYCPGSLYKRPSSRLKSFTIWGGHTRSSYIMLHHSCRNNSIRGEGCLPDDLPCATTCDKTFTEEFWGIPCDRIPVGSTLRYPTGRKTFQLVPKSLKHPKNRHSFY